MHKFVNKKQMVYWEFYNLNSRVMDRLQALDADICELAAQVPRIPPAQIDTLEKSFESRKLRSKYIPEHALILYIFPSWWYSLA